MTTKLRAWLLGSAVAASMFGAPAAWAQPDNDDVTSRLIELLIKKGVLARDEANLLLQQAKAEKAEGRHKPRPEVTAAKPAAETPPPPAADETIPPGTVRVTYVPQIVRDQIAQQVKSELLQQASANAGANVPPEPGIPDRFHFFGDLRLRGELDEFRGGNAPQFPDFASINNGSPYDITGTSGAVPLLDTTEDRSRFRLRARAGVDVQIDDGLSAEIRIATGNDASPVSANQTLGQNGPFAKYALWLDRAYVKEAPLDWLALYAGRMDNPFWTTDLIYYDDLAFDGVAVTASPKLSKHLSGFLSAGAFPVFNSAFNFGTTSADSAYSSHDAWLFAVQGGAEWHASEDIVTKFAAGYFAYSGINGKISSPCTLVFSSDTCDTDDTRTLFPGNGNTMMPLRDIVLAPNNTQPQYFGLATPFRILDLHGRAELTTFDPIVVALETEVSINLAFDRAQVEGRGVNNFNGTTNSPDAGNKAWMVRVSAGDRTIAKRWDWNVSLTYKYLESDSVLASLNDPDFHLGGTNAKGFILAGNLGIARNTWITARWLSSTQVSGAPYGVDVIQADLNVKF